MPTGNAPSVTLCQWKHDAPLAYSMAYGEGTVDTLANALPVHERFGFPGQVARGVHHRAYRVGTISTGGWAIPYPKALGDPLHS